MWLLEKRDEGVSWFELECHCDLDVRTGVPRQTIIDSVRRALAERRCGVTVDSISVSRSEEEVNGRCFVNRDEGIDGDQEPAYSSSPLSSSERSPSPSEKAAAPRISSISLAEEGEVRKHAPRAQPFGSPPDQLPSPRPGPGGRCQWCLDVIPSDASKSTVWCPGRACWPSARDALAREAKRWPFDVKTFVASLEARGRARHEALRALPHAAIDHELLGIDGADLAEVAWPRNRYARCAAAGCNELLGVRVTDATCGAPACKQWVYRRRKSDARLRLDDGRIHDLIVGGQRAVALRLAAMISEGVGPQPSDRLVDRMRLLEAKLCPFEWRSLARLADVARTRPLSPIDATEAAAVLIAYGVEFIVVRGEIRFRDSPWPWPDESLGPAAPDRQDAG